MSEDWQYDPAHDLELSRSQRRRSLNREPGLAGLASNFLWRGLSGGYMALAHRLSIEGRQNLPTQPPYVLVANHASHLDAVILELAAPRRHLGRIFPIAAGDTFFEKPMLATFATACMNALPIWRKRCGGHSLDELRRRLVEEKCVFILFPEGTRTRNGKPGRFKPGLGRLVCETSAPVVPCFIDGAWRAMPPSASLPRPKKIRLRIGTPLVFNNAANDRQGWEAAVAEVEHAVKALAEA